MSTLKPDDVVKVAHLARLAITEDEIQVHVKNLSNILTLVEEMNQVNTKEITPMAHPLDIPQPMRTDKITEHNQRELLQTTAEPAAIKSGLYIVPKAYE